MIKNILHYIKSWHQESRKAAQLQKQHLINYASQQLADAAENIKQHHNDYAELKRLLDGYQIRDVNGEILQTEWSDNDHITLNEIKATAGYKELRRLAEMYNLRIKLKEEESEEFDDEERIIYYLDISKK